MTVTTDVSVAYLGSSALQLADPRDDVRGMVAVDPQGLRLGEVEDVVVDIAERRVRLLLVRSGGILGLPDSRTLVPVTSITTDSGRVRVEHTHDSVHRRGVSSESDPDGPPTADGRFDAQQLVRIYQHYDATPFWRGRSLPCSALDR